MHIGNHIMFDSIRNYNDTIYILNIKKRFLNDGYLCWIPPLIDIRFLIINRMSNLINTYKCDKKAYDVIDSRLSKFIE